MWNLWWTKWSWGRFSPNTLVPLPIFIPPIAPQSSSSIIWGSYNRPVVAAVPSELTLTSLKIIKIIITTKFSRSYEYRSQILCQASEQVATTDPGLDISNLSFR
jgi:hypothetical protein